MQGGARTYREIYPPVATYRSNEGDCPACAHPERFSGASSLKGEPTELMARMRVTFTSDRRDTGRRGRYAIV